jgi:serine/threonine protein kinase
VRKSQITNQADDDVEFAEATDTVAGPKVEVSTHSLIDQTTSGQSKVVPAAVSSVSKSASDLPDVFGRYKVRKKLGSGAMGAVYLARDTLLDRDVALKTPTFENDEDGELLKRFYREARAVSKIKHHNLCGVYDVGEIDGRHYISMEFVPGRKLSEFIKPDQPMTEKQAMAVVRKIALAMHDAHSHGVIHRDLKPDNIMINEKGEPVVMDFGLVHKTDSKSSTMLSQRGSLIGSPAYMSKEQVEGEHDKLTPATDQYSLGVILYQLLTSKLPFEGGLHAVLGAILTKEPPSPSQYRPDLNSHLEAVCLKMMAKQAKDRYASMKAASEAIAEVAKGRSKAARSTNKTLPAATTSSETIAHGLTPLFTGLQLNPEQHFDVESRNQSQLQPSLQARGVLYNRAILGSIIAGMAVLLSVMWFRSDAKIKVLSDDVQVTFNNASPTLPNGPRETAAAPSKQTLHIKPGDIEIGTDKNTFNRDNNSAVTIERQKSEVVASLGKREIGRGNLTTRDPGDRVSKVDWKSWRTVHLLDKTDIAADSRRGQWKLTTDGILSQTSNSDGQVAFPIDLPSEYSVSFEGTRTPSSPVNNRSLGIVLPMQGRSVMVRIDTDDEGGLSGLVANDQGDWEESTLISGQQLPNGEKFYVRCVVHKDSLDIFWQGHRRIHWQGQPNELGCKSDFQFKELPVLSLVCQGPYEFSKLRLAPLKLSGTDDIDVMELVDVRRDTLQGAFQVCDNGIEGLKRNVDSYLELPVEPPEEYTLHLTGRRTSTIGWGIVGLVAAGQPINALFDGSAIEGGGLELIDGQGVMRGPTAIPVNRFTDQIPFELECRVSRDRIVVLGDGRRMIDWPAEATRFSRPSGHGQSIGLTLGCAGSSYEFSRIRLGPPKPEPSPDDLVPGQKIDLLSLIDPDRDAFHGKFTKNSDGSIQFPQQVAFARLAVPRNLPEEYELHAEVEAPGGWAELVFDMPVAQGRGSLLIDAWHNGSRPSGLELDGGFKRNLTTRWQEVLKPGIHTLVVRVARTGVQFLCDGTDVIDWRGSPRRLATAGGWNVPGRHVLGIGCYFRPYRLKMLELRPLSIARKPFASATKPVNGDLLAIINPDRDSIDGQWVMEGTALLSPLRADDVTAALRVPYELGDEYEVTAKVQRRDGADAFAMDIPVGGRRCRIVFDGWSSSVRRSGIDSIDGMDPVVNGSGQVGTFIPKGKVRDLRVIVEREKQGRYCVRGIAGGTEVIFWQGYPSQLSSDLHLRPGEERDLFLRTYASFAITEFRYRPLKPEDRVARTDSRIAPRKKMSEASRLKFDWPKLQKLALNWDVKWFRLPTNKMDLLKEFPNRTDASAFTNTTRANLKWTSMEMEGNPLKQSDWFGLRANTKTTLPGGRYAVFSESDDGVRIRVDDKTIFEHWAGRDAGGSNHSEFTLSAGVHTFQVDYFELEGGSSCNVEFAYLDSVMPDD